MQAFVKHTGIVAPLDRVNVDTDAIIPKQFLKRIERTGFGQYLFFDWRFEPSGKEISTFLLNQPTYKTSSILLSRANFGCGSSREHAPWALEDYGFRCLIAPSFADIFYNNCFKNGILPIVLSEEKVDQLFQQLAAAPGAQFSVDLEKNVLTTHQGESIPFTVDPFRRDCLLRGLDDIGLTLQHESLISEFERRRA